MSIKNIIAAALIAVFLSGCWAHHGGSHNFHGFGHHGHFHHHR